MWFKQVKQIICGFILLCIVTLPVQAEVQRITIHQAKELYDNGALFIDTRSLFERKLGVIRKALAISKNDIINKQSLLPADKSQIIVTYCAVGVRAGVAADRLDQLGYQNVYVIHNAGFRDWKKSGFPVE